MRWLRVAPSRLSSAGNRRSWWPMKWRPDAKSGPMVGPRNFRSHSVTKTRAVGLKAADGGLLWQFPWVVLQGNRNIAQPVMVSTNRLFLSAGYGTGCALIEVSRTNNGFNAREVWRNKNLKNKFTSSVC